jgi:hypothetical protein
MMEKRLAAGKGYEKSPRPLRSARAGRLTPPSLPTPWNALAIAVAAPRWPIHELRAE